MKFSVMTLFPDMVNTVLSESIIGRAQESGRIEIECVNIRDFSTDKHRKTDDTPYGGGVGMVMTCQPIYDCYENITKDIPEDNSKRVIYMSPKGRMFSHEVARELCYIFDASDIFPERILVAGLGNPALTPDSIGCECARIVKPTMHIRDMNKQLFEDLNCAEIAVCTPGVAANSGLDAAVTIRGLCETLGPDAVIVIDALASRAVERLGTTVQICNTGVAPGSGLGNPRQPISIDTVGVPVIAVGVPTIIDSRMFYYNPNNEKQPARPETYPSMFVSPKEINEIVDAAALIIGGGINQAFGIYGVF